MGVVHGGGWFIRSSHVALIYSPKPRIYFIHYAFVGAEKAPSGPALGVVPSMVLGLLLIRGPGLKCGGLRSRSRSGVPRRVGGEFPPLADAAAATAFLFFLVPQMNPEAF